MAEKVTAASDEVRWSEKVAQEEEEQEYINRKVLLWSRSSRLTNFDVLMFAKFLLIYSVRHKVVGYELYIFKFPGIVEFDITYMKPTFWMNYIGQVVTTR